MVYCATIDDLGRLITKKEQSLLNFLMYLRAMTVGADNTNVHAWAQDYTGCHLNRIYRRSMGHTKPVNSPKRTKRRRFLPRKWKNKLIDNHKEMWNITTLDFHGTKHHSLEKEEKDKMELYLIDYINKMLKKADYEYDSVTNSWCASVDELPGAYAQADTIEEARSDLVEVMEEYVFVSLQEGHPLPEFKDFRQVA